MQAHQTLVGPPFCAWEEFRRRPATYAAWASICTDDWTHLSGRLRKPQPHPPLSGWEAAAATCHSILLS
eukprot:7023359-Heterocapsa_arctica.AAC.1